MSIITVNFDICITYGQHMIILCILKIYDDSLPNSEIISKFHFASKVNGKNPSYSYIKKIIHNVNKSRPLSLLPK